MLSRVFPMKTRGFLRSGLDGSTCLPCTNTRRTGTHIGSSSDLSRYTCQGRTGWTAALDYFGYLVTREGYPTTNDEDDEESHPYRCSNHNQERIDTLTTIVGCLSKTRAGLSKTRGAPRRIA